MRRILRGRIRDLTRGDLPSEIIQTTVLSEQLGEKLQKVSPTQTRSFGSITGLVVVNRFVLINLEDVSGVIQEVVMKSASGIFRVYLKIDGREVLDNTFSDISSVTDDLSSIEAFVDTAGESVLHFGGFGFRESAYVSVVASNLKFDSLYALVEVHGK